ncbi:MAG: 2-succinyl-5-enolpyruvyl-6-hydroxy-3-cyclohexene-1-carboxylic-acid synthase, partial [Acidimicrobiales bacterium]
MTSPDQITAASHFLSGCVQAGLRRLVLSPGSRSTPLAIAAHRLAGLDVSVHLDERSAAFAALGEAKASGAPVAVACTSGTAAANHLPAIAEANKSGVPLISITADRPPEHVDWGVGQAFDQLGLFHRQVRVQITMPVGADGGLDHAVRAGVRAANTAAVDNGPVHVNWPFRLPVEPTVDAWPDPPRLSVEHPVGPLAVKADSPGPAATAIDAADRAVIIAGPGAFAGSNAVANRAAIVDLARRRGWPIFADALSGLRGTPDANLVDGADQLCASATLPSVDLVIRLGDTPTAKTIRLWWERSGSPQVLVDPRRRWHDPSHAGTHLWHGSVDDLVATSTRYDRSGDADTWIDLGHRARAAIDEVVAESPFSEIHVTLALDAAVEAHEGDVVVVASSSMPVREVDSFFGASTSAEVFSNRGINGIDGVVSTAIGVARAPWHFRSLTILSSTAELP